MTDKTKALKTLHTRLIDSIDGYEQAHENMDGAHKAFAERCISERRQFHDTLHDQLVKDGIEVSESGSTAAAVHRQVFNIRDALSSGDSGILAECARGDSHLLKAYDEAMEATDSAPAYAFLVDQRTKVAAAEADAKSFS